MTRYTGPIMLTIASLADVATTWYALKYSGALEGNPLMSSVAQSVPAMLLVKAIAIGIIWYILTRKVLQPWRTGMWVLANAITFGVVFNNVLVIGGWL